MLCVLDKISLLIFWVLATCAFLESKAPNFEINLFLSFTYWILIIVYRIEKLSNVNKNADIYNMDKLTDWILQYILVE